MAGGHLTAAASRRSRSGKGARRSWWRRPLPLAAAAVFLVLLVLALRAIVWRPPELVGPEPDDADRRVAGVVHVHTTASDGGGSPEEVVAAARRAGLRFLVITDHNATDAKRVEGYHGELLVLVGAEVSTTAGHVLGVGIRPPTFRFSGDASDALEDIRDLGGQAFAAHPLSDRPDFRWTGWDLPGPWGLELLNLDSQWRAAGWPRLARAALVYPFNRRYALAGSLTAPGSTLTEWDELLRQRDMPGMAGSDAHGRLELHRRLVLGLPSYDALFALARQHLVLPRPLSGRFEADRDAVVEALAHGRGYAAIDALGPAEGFSFAAEAGGRRRGMGETVPPSADLGLRAGGRMPQGTRVRILRDGQTVAEGVGPLVETPGAAVGAYRAEAWLSGWDVPWVVTNPIYVFDAATAEARAARARWPPADPPPAAAQVLDGFEGPSRFGPEFDPSSSMEQPYVVPGAGLEGAAARLRFRLGTPGPGRPYVWCALVNREARDLSGRNGLVFAIRGDGVYRIWVQVRDENPASPDDGVESWFASVKTTTEWRRVEVPFKRLRSINVKSDGQLGLDRVRQLVFVLDHGAVAPGTSGTIWLDEVGVY